MEYILAVFRSRTQTLSFDKILRSYGVKCRIVNTPKQVIVACGLSIKLSVKDFEDAFNIFCRRNFDNFAGFFYVKENGKSMTIQPIN